MPFQRAMKDGQEGAREADGKKDRGSKNVKQWGGGGEKKRGRKLFSLCFPFKDILTGQSPLCGMTGAILKSPTSRLREAGS